MKKEKEIKELRKQGMIVRDISKKLKVSTTTINKVINPKFYQLCLRSNNKYRINNLAKLKVYHKKRQQDMKKMIISFYSKGESTCACCTENNIEFLSVDHIKGDGNIHRREIGSSLYTWLVRNKMPEGFRILCMNCNHSYGHYGMCPHNLNKC